MVTKEEVGLVPFSYVASPEIALSNTLEALMTIEAYLNLSIRDLNTMCSLRHSLQWKFVQYTLERLQFITRSTKKLSSINAPEILLCNPAMYKMNPMLFINIPQANNTA